MTIEEHSEWEILQSALDTFGIDSQVDKMIEEMSELTQALLKLRRLNGFKVLHKDTIETWNNVHEEIVDVEIVLSQMKLLFTPDLLERYRVSKLARLKQRIEEYGKSNL